MVTRVSREALWSELAPASAGKLHAAKAASAPEPAIDPAVAPGTAPSGEPAATASSPATPPENEVWSLLLAHSETTVSALGDLAESLHQYAGAQSSAADNPTAQGSTAQGSTAQGSTAQGSTAQSSTARGSAAQEAGDRRQPGGMLLLAGRLVNRAGHTPQGLNTPSRPTEPQATSSAAQASETSSIVTGSTSVATASTPAAQAASAAAGSSRPPAEFPWPGWPRAPMPRSDNHLIQWRPFATPVVQSEPQPAA